MSKFEYGNSDYDPDIDIKGLIVRLFYIGVVSCSLMLIVGMVIL
jgi:hypothetical protein